MPHRISYRMYYEDTDALGMVYHANYFKFMERGRSEYVAQSSRSVAEWNADGYFVVVAAASAKFRKPAKLFDLIDVVSTFSVPSPHRGRMDQRIERDGELLVSGVIDLACLNRENRVIPFPEDFLPLG